MAIAQAKEGIEKELTCPLCLDIFQDPKRLPCDHIYCKDPCLKGLVLRSQNATITCPECRTVVQVPHNDVNNLPTAFQINRFKELYQKMKENDETDSPSTLVKQKEPATCATHVSQPIALYCETCNEVLCRDCVIKSDKHKEHNYGYIDEVADKQRKQIASQLKPARELESKLSTAIENISQVEENIVTQGQTQLKQVEDTFDAIIDALKKEKELLKLNISAKVQQKCNTLTSQKEEMTACLTELSDTIGKVNDVTTQSNEYLVHSKTKIEKQITTICQRAQSLSVQPNQAPDSGMCLTSSDEIRACYKKGNYQYKLADPEKCKLDSFGSLETGKPSTTTLHLRNFAGKKCTNQQQVQVELVCIRDNSVIHGEVFNSITGKQLISITPQKRGRHRITVKVNSFHIAGSPFTTYAHKPPHQLSAPISVIAHVFEPDAMYSLEDKLYVTSTNKAIVMLNENWETIMTHKFEGAFELTIDSETEDCFVSDSKLHQLHKVDKQGRLIKSVGGFGTQCEHFSFPNGLQISRKGEIFVCDTDNHRIKVYNRELKLLHTFGEQGNKPGCFNCPDNIAIDESGNVFVSEEYNNRVQVLSPDGKFIRMIGKAGSKPGYLNTPIGIGINDQHVFIIDQGNKRVSVFTTQGEFVATFGNKYIENPMCIAIDRDGYVYVSDNRQRIVVF